jgi:hypothetical protein
MEPYDNPAIIRVDMVANGSRQLLTKFIDCGHTGLLHVENGSHVKPKLIKAKPRETAAYALMSLHDTEVAALFGVLPSVFSVPDTMAALANHFFVKPSDQSNPPFTSEIEFIQWLADRPLTACFASHQEAAEQLARYAPNPDYPAVMGHWQKFLEQLPERQLSARASA